MPLDPVKLKSLLGASAADVPLPPIRAIEQKNNFNPQLPTYGRS
jgi:hypothetical protein